MVVNLSGPMSSPTMNPASTVAGGGMSKVFMLDKYFTELQKFWATEKRLQGNSDSTFVL